MQAYGPILNYHLTDVESDQNLYRKYRSLKLAAYYESFLEFNRRITELIKLEATDNYASGEAAVRHKDIINLVANYDVKFRAGATL